MKMRLPILAAFAALSIACASSAGPRATSGPRSDSRTLVAADLEAATQTNLYDLIAAHRGRWLDARTTGFSGRGSGLRVFMDGRDIGGVEALRTQSPDGIAYLRYYTPSEATARFNVQNIAAVIEIVSKR